MMRNFTYKIVVAIVVFISYAVGSNAQTPVPTVSVDLNDQPKNEFKLVPTIDDEGTVYHAVSGTTVEFTLAEYDSKYIYSYERLRNGEEVKRENVNPTNKKFTLNLTNNISDNDSVRYTYKFYASEAGNTSSPFSIDFAVYKEPKIEEIKLIPSQKYHILGSDNEVNVQLEYTPSIYWGESGDFIDVDWLLVDNITNSNITDGVHDNEYVLPGEISSGKKDFSVTIKALAPDGSTEWVKEEITTSIQVYDTPSVKLTPASPYAIVGGAEIDVKLDFTAETDSALQGVENSSIKIKTDNWLGAAKNEDSELSAQFKANSENLDTQTISTTVVWYYMDDSNNEIPLYTYGDGDGDDEKLSATIMVYATPSVKLTPASPYAISGGAEIAVDVDLSGTDSELQGEESIKIKTDNWSGAVKKADNELSASFNPSADGINTGQGNSITTAVTWYYEDEGSNKKINLYTKELKDIENGAASIQVYATPSVKLTPASPYAIVDGAEIDVKLDFTAETDSALQGVENSSIKIKTDNWLGAAKNEDSELSAQFKANSENLDTQTISTTVVWYYMDDSNNEIPLYTYGDGDGDDEKLSATIMVYATPSVKLTPASPYAIVNGNAIDVRLDLDDVNDPSMQKPGEIQISATWTDAEVNNDDKLSAKFNPAEKEPNDYTITSEVKWYYKDGENELTLYCKNLENTETGAAEIKVYAEPTYNLDTDDIYNSFVDVEIPIGTFIINNNNIVSNREIIKNLELVVDDTKNKESYTPVKPEAEKAFQLDAIYEYGGTTLYNKTKNYKINIIAAPVWDPNFDEIFGTNANGEADNYLYTTFELLSRCSKVIEVQQSNNSDVAIGLSGKYSINDDSPSKFTFENSSLKSVPLRDLCSSLNMDQENMINFSFSYEVQNLLELEGNTDLKCKNETAYIYLCENIDATLPDNPSLEFYTRVGDGKINDLKTDQISLTVVGGDPGLWKFELQDASGNNVLSDDDTETENESVKINIDYAGLDFSDKDAGSQKSYKLYAEYVDGITEIGTNDYKAEIKINVEPEPKLDDLVVGLIDKGVTYNPVNENYDYDIKCYEGDKIKLSSSSNTSNTSSTLSWKYKVGSKTDMQDITWDNNISFNSEDEIGTIEFYSYLNDSKERLVKTINLQVEYVKTPTVDINHELPDVREENKAQIPDLWNNSTSIDYMLDLYAGWEDLISFNPQDGFEGGWTYKWKLDDEVVSTTTKFDHTLDNPTGGYKEQVISFYYKNSIPASDYQDRENVGIEETKSYYVRVWRKAELPDEITLKDDYNVAPDHINKNKAIRVGNKLSLSVSKIKYGYNPPQGEGSYNEYTLKENDRELDIDSNDPDTLKSVIGCVQNDKPDNGLGSGKNTYKFSFSNKGPRDFPWEEGSITETITVYNRPKTPSSLIRKGNGNSGTLIITYDDEYMNMSLLKPEDYSVVFVCEDTVVIKVPKDENDRHWITTGLEGITINDMSDAYAYTCLNYTKDNGWEQNVRITSGRIIDGEIKEDWDESEYKLTDEQMAEARARTRAGGGDYTAIQSVESEEGVVSVYNTSGVKVATSTENLKPGIYIIRSMQNGEMNSKKLSVK